MEKNLAGKVAVVAGASRGAGRGIALALGDAGATVYIAARTVRGGPKPQDGAPGVIEETAQEVTSRGGQGIAVRTDCTDEKDVASLFDRIQTEQGRIDVLASSIFDGIGFMRGWGRPFWQQPVTDWREGMTGAHAIYLTARHSAKMMSAQRSGLIVGVTDMILGEGPRGYAGHLMMDLGHECINRLLFDISHELKKHKVSVITLMPGFMRTERVMMHMTSEKVKKQFGFDRSESPEYLGRATAALAADPHYALSETGKVLFVADIAKRYGLTDVDGKYIPRFAAHAS